MNRRRSFLAAVGATLAAGGFPVIAQQAPRRISWVASGTMAESAPLLDALRDGLRELGYVEGRDIIIDAYWGEHSAERVQNLVKEIIATRPNVIVTLGPATIAVHRAVSGIPLIFGFSGDPVQAGFVKTFARPGGNATGISFLALELVAKRIEFLKLAMSDLKRIAIAANAQHPGDQAERRASEAAAREMSLDVEYFEVSGTPQIDRAMAAIKESGHTAVVMFPIQSIISNSARIAAWSLQNRIATISGWAQFAEAGNLMSYGANPRAVFHRLAHFSDRVLRGAKPADLPVEAPAIIELIINLRTARALAIQVPRSLLLRADRVIE